MNLESSKDRQTEAALERRDDPLPSPPAAFPEGVEETPDHAQMIKKVVYETRGKHTFARIFMGPNDDEVTLCGSLMFKDVEFNAYQKVLRDGAVLSPEIKVIFVDSSNESNGR